MFKKLTVTGLALLMLLCAGCGQKVDNESSTPVDTQVSDITSSEEEPVYYTNPLTGVVELDAGVADRRPVAIMINNIAKAQGVQTGLCDADIVYETEVEGGITRLMAVYQDVSKVERIGTIRSARYAYIDLAMGHNAIYIHCGQDPNYAKPHLKDVNHIDISEQNYGKRISNGLSSEHTMYTYGNTLWKGLTSKFKTENKGADMWQSFAAEDETVTLAGGVANAVTVPFSNSYKTRFTYDGATGLYTRSFNGTVRTDYLSGETVKFKNVVVLLTSITDYPDGAHRKISLSGGDGYYITNGGYTPIKWSKGNASSSLKFTNTDGTALNMSAGNTWVCIASSSKSAPTFE